MIFRSLFRLFCKINRLSAALHILEFAEERNLQHQRSVPIVDLMMDSWEKHQQIAIISKFWRMSAEIPSFACHPGHLMIEGTSDVGSGCSFSCRSFPTSKKHHSGIIEYAPKYGHEYNMYIHNVCMYIYIIIHIKYKIIYDTSYSLYMSILYTYFYISMKYHSKYW